MALPDNSTIYHTQNWEDEYKRARFGSADGLTRRQERQFNRYARSKKGEAARIAYDKAEMDKFNQSVDRALASRSAAMQKAAADFTASITPPPAPVVKATTPPEAPPEVPPTPPEVPALVLKDAARWNQVASQYGFKDYNAVAAWQKANGLEADGKFGAASYAKWAQLNPDKVSTVPVIKPRVVTPQTPKTPVTPTEEQTTPLIPEGYVELSRPDGTTFLQRTKSKSTTSGTTSGAAPTAPANQSTGFDLEAFRQAQNLKSSAFVTHNGKRYLRYDPSDVGDFYIGEDGNIYRAEWGGGVGDLIDHSKHLTYSTPNGTRWERNYNDVYNAVNGFKTTPVNKRGGTMNRINYFQQGGAAPQQDMQQQVVALVQAAMQGDKKATETVNKIMEAAKAGDQQAMQIAQMIQQVAQKMQGQATAAKWGSKLNYVRSLKFAKGGKACPECEKAKQVEMKACGGKKAKKRYFGGLV